MPSKKRRDLITTNAKGGFRFRLEAAIADIPELRTHSITTAIIWLAGYALDILYRGLKVSIPQLIASKMRDKRFEWARMEGDPVAAKKLAAKTAEIDYDRFCLIAKGEASPTEEDLSGLASAFEMDIDDVIDSAEGRGPLINGEGRVHAEHR